MRFELAEIRVNTFLLCDAAEASDPLGTRFRKSLGDCSRVILSASG
jgi:hypothetical protein